MSVIGMMFLALALRRRRSTRAAQKLQLDANEGSVDDPGAYLAVPTPKQEHREALGKTGDTRAVEPLISALHDKDSRVRYGAVNALERIGDTRAVEPLSSVALQDDDWNVRYCAVVALERIDDTHAIGLFTDALHDQTRDVRLRAVEALLEFGDARAIKPLSGALHDSDKDVRESAAEALKALSALAAVPRHKQKQRRRTSRSSLP